jgi:vancomycin permeability regulator SanA
VTGANLFHDKKVEKLLMTGDDGGFHVNEVATMKRLAMTQGVPEENILVDGHGYRTYESCKRAAEVFHIKQAIIVTQRFHLGRALYLCDAFGIEVQGVKADRQHYLRIVHFTLRDLLASAKAWWDVNVDAPEPPVQY